MDKDLAAVQEVRDLCKKANSAQIKFKEFSQEQVDRIVYAMTEAGFAAATRLAEMAIAETGFGKLKDKIEKNQFATRNIHKFIAPLKTVGIIENDSHRKIKKIAEPMGVIAGIIPSTNPTSTALFKSLIAVKSRNSIIFSPHPKAIGCIQESVNIMRKAAEAAGAPPDLINCLTLPAMEGTRELMQHHDIAVILATGGAGLVKAAYSAGKPAYGVGPGNVPAFIERTANVKKAVADIVISKTFDNGTVCASEQSVIVDQPVEHKVIQAFKQHRAYFMSDAESDMTARALVSPHLEVNPKLVGQPASVIAQAAGFSVPPETSILIARQRGVGNAFPLTIEKLSPVLTFFVENGWEAGCERCIEVLNFGGLGHTLVIHSTDESIIEQFGLKKPAFRILVNTPGTHGAIGLTTNLEPSLTLGCGTYGGNITADNVTPMHLLNIKRVAYEVNPVTQQPGQLSETAKTDTARTFPYQSALASFSSRKIDSPAAEASINTKQPLNSNNHGLTFGNSGMGADEVEKIVREFLAQRNR
ncbi:acetaldehyde dehydrogenase (acetylating) [candidate division KSB1 bacterium]|nr:acetaldehyde dehydrogenase (acetylating) [candidate division KSB1 bacterium]